MRYALNAKQMKEVDQYSIDTIKIPSMVLMERAAYAVTERVIAAASHLSKIIVICHTGNNGGDGIAVARMLFLKGYDAAVWLLGDTDHMTLETKQQYIIACNLGLSIMRECDLSEYNILVDAIFGIGLSRNIEGRYAEIVVQINERRNRKADHNSHCYVIAVDIPSGISADDGSVKGIAVMADETVTFGEQKLGLMLYPGVEYAGKTIVADIGFAPLSKAMEQEAFYYYEESDLNRLPVRKAYSNKGTYGRVLVIAGSDTVTGAAYFTALAAYRMGAGLVKILTAKKAIPVLQTLLPEALFAAYDENQKLNQEEVVRCIAWATVIAAGPGIGTDPLAQSLVETVIAECKVPLVLDADALNILAMKANGELLGTEERFSYFNNILSDNTILTPHLKEFSRLSLYSLNKILSILIDKRSDVIYNTKLTYVIKDTRTIVTSRNLKYLNQSGNHGMATGGSGDVLSGVIAGLIATGIKLEEAATLGVYVHGLAGDAAAKAVGAPFMLARDIIDALSAILKDYEGRSL